MLLKYALERFAPFKFTLAIAEFASFKPALAQFAFFGLTFMQMEFVVLKFIIVGFNPTKSLWLAF